MFQLPRLSLGLVLLGALLAASCGGSSSSNPADTAAPGQLAQVCPTTIKVLTDWFPEPEHNYLYQLIGVAGEIDASEGTYSGPIGDGSVELVIQAGGPYIGHAAQSVQFYSDDSYYMAFVNTSEAIRAHASTPVVAVFSNFEVGPQIFMWDPAVYSFDSFEDIGDSGATVLHFGGDTIGNFLVQQGFVELENTDSTYDGSPARFITEGNLVQQGFATNEPYRYENEIEGWLKPVDFLLLHDAGYHIYQSALSVKPETITDDADCLAALVPMFQQALVDYMVDPEPINVRLDEIVTELDSFWTSSVAGHADSAKKMRELGLVTDGDSGYVGDMDAARIQGLIDKLGPQYGAAGVKGFERDGSTDLQAEEVFTNRFLDPTISLGF